MKKNTWKRHAALALVGAMAVGSLYGCGSKSASSDNTQTTAGETTGGASSDGKEKLVIALQTYSFITDYDNNYLTKLLEEKLGIDIEFYLLSADSSEATTQLSLMVSAGEEMPDIICTNGALSKEAILDYGSKGVLIPLGDMLNVRRSLQTLTL